MQPLKIEATGSTPVVVLDKDKGIFEISGISLPNDAIGFYQPVINWFNNYIETPNPATKLIFKLEYFNSASSKIFMGILRAFDNAIHSGREILVEWCYIADDADTLEAGKDYASMVEIPFIFTEI
jgi:hypothetical protein